MQKIREWSFPVGVLIAWLVASVYTASVLSKMYSAMVRQPAQIQAPADVQPAAQPTT